MKGNFRECLKYACTADSDVYSRHEQIDVDYFPPSKKSSQCFGKSSIRVQRYLDFNVKCQFDVPLFFTSDSEMSLFSLLDMGQYMGQYEVTCQLDRIDRRAKITGGPVAISRLCTSINIKRSLMQIFI